MGLFGRRKSDLIEWQNMLITTPSNKLLMTEQQLIMTSQQVASNHIRILKDSAKLCNETKKPDVFFERYNLLIEHSKQLVRLSKYVKFSSVTPQMALDQTINQRGEAIRQLIERCFEDAETLKTDPSKRRRYNKILADFTPFKSEIDEENWHYIENTCLKRIEGN